MGRTCSVMLIVLLLALQGRLMAQNKASEKLIPAGPKAIDFPRNIIPKNSKIDSNKYPQPYNERLVLTADEVSPLEITYHAEEQRNIGSQMKFRAMLRNIGNKDFDFVPGDFLVAVVNEQGVQMPAKDIVWNANAQGDEGAYRIKPGKSNGRYIQLGIGDFSAKIGTKYFVVVTYLHVYEKPAPAIDSLVTVLPVKVVEASESPRDRSAKK